MPDLIERLQEAAAAAIVNQTPAIPAHHHPIGPGRPCHSFRQGGLR